MKFGLLVTAAPFESQASQTATRFVRAALDQGHTVVRVFFFLAGVANANGLRSPTGGGQDLAKVWSELATCNKVELVACITAAGKRGISEDAIAPGFSLAGLGQLAELIAEVDRLIVFGG